MKVQWELVESEHAHTMYRAKVFGGWIVTMCSDVLTPMNRGYNIPSMENGYEWRESICFVPDPKHEWI